MKVKVKVYDRCKYLEDAEEVAVVFYPDVDCFAIYRSEQFKDGYLDQFDECDDYDEYLVLYFRDGERSTFRNSRVDVFKEGV